MKEVYSSVKGTIVYHAYVWSSNLFYSWAALKYLTAEEPAIVSKHKSTFFPIPLVGDGAGDTGIKSMRFGDEDADFSKSLSLWGNKVTTHNYIKAQVLQSVEGTGTEGLREKNSWTAEACWSLILPTQPDLQRLVALLTPTVLIWHVCARPLHKHEEAVSGTRATTCSGEVQQAQGLPVYQQNTDSRGSVCVCGRYQTQALFPGLAHLHGCLDLTETLKRRRKRKREGKKKLFKSHFLQQGVQCTAAGVYRRLKGSNAQLTAHEPSPCSSHPRPLPAKYTRELNTVNRLCKSTNNELLE